MDRTTAGQEQSAGQAGLARSMNLSTRLIYGCRWEQNEAACLQNEAGWKKGFLIKRG